MLKNLVKRILQELLFHYIKQKAKQTSKRRDNSSSTMSLQNPLTKEPRGTTIATSSIGTSEKIIMETQTEDIVGHVREWAIEKLHQTASDNRGNADAISQEFYEWIYLDETEGQLEIMSLEKVDDYYHFD